ncbi:MAG: hypothetical protein ACLP29_01275 [Dissulfurispiraceae bacterium]
MDILSGLKKDIEDGIKQGVDAVKSTATMVKEKAEELTEKGKTQYRIYELKNKGQKQRASLGEKFRELVKTKKMKVSNEELTKLLSAIDKTDDALAKLEGKEAASTPKKPAPKTVKPKTQKVALKKTTKKAAPKSTSAKPSN